MRAAGRCAEPSAAVDPCVLALDESGAGWCAANMRARQTAIDWSRYRLRVTKDGLKVAAIPVAYSVLMIGASLNAARLNTRFGWAVKPLGEDPMWTMAALFWLVIALVLLWRHGLPKDRSKG